MDITYFVTTGDGMGGTEGAAITQANAFAGAGDSVTVLSLYRDSGMPSFKADPRIRFQYLLQLDPDREGRPIAERIAEMGGPSRLVPREWDDQFCAKSDVAVAAALSDLKTDILVATTPALTALASEFAPPQVIIVEQEHRATIHRSRESLEPLLLHAPRIDCLVSLTERSTEWLRSTLGDRAPRLETIPNAIPDVFFPRADLDSKLVMSAGRFVPGKNFTGLIRAFASASETVPGWRLRIYGHGPRERQLRALIRTLQLENSVELVPPVPDLISEWSKAAVFALSSRSEGLPLVALEAMAAGLPLVAFDCETGPAEIIVDDVNGILVPDGDIHALAEALVLVMADAGRRRRYSENSLVAVGRFSPSSILSKWRDLFNSLRTEAATTPNRLERTQRLQVSVTDQVSRPTSQGRILRTATQGTLVTRTLEELTPESVTRRNFAIVERILSTAEIPHFWVPGMLASIEVLAVPADEREAVLRALSSEEVASIAVFPMSGNSRLTVEPWLPSTGRPISPTIERATGLRVYQQAVDPTGSVQAIHTRACDIEFWRLNREGFLEAPRPNRTIDLVRADDLQRLVSTTVRGVKTRTTPLLGEGVPWQQPTFPIDAVYTWVDDTDPSWVAHRFAAQEAASGGLHAESMSDARFRNRDELKYSIRALDAYAPWVRHVYLVTAGQKPPWLVDHPGITLVDHREIFPDESVLPTFNSHAIEAALHRIEGLAEHYLYLNDDVMLASTQEPSTYFEASGNSKFFVSPVKINDLGPDAPPHLAAAANNRSLIRRDFGIAISQGMLHTPCVQRRSIGYEIEERYSDEWRSTLASKFRSPSDISISSSLSHYLAYATGRAAVGSIKYRYLGLGAPDLSARMNQVLRSADVDVIALGDPPGGVEDAESVDRMVENFLEQLLPWPSRFETKS